MAKPQSTLCDKINYNTTVGGLIQPVMDRLKLLHTVPCNVVSLSLPQEHGIRCEKIFTFEADCPGDWVSVGLDEQSPIAFNLSDPILLRVLT